MYDLDQLRRTEFPLSAHELYFNHAGISPIPERSRQKMQWSVGRLAENPYAIFKRMAFRSLCAFRQTLPPT
ncbi:MAG: hypothetical protein HC915_00325 [Anaerolineae bacterium]|nr:hypothetical protein [Anaerolineae bacterium]